MSLSLLEAASEMPGRLALLGGDQPVTFSDLAVRVREHMAALERRGATADALVSLVATLEVKTLVSLYSLIELGAPVLLVHPRFARSERERLYAEMQPTLCLGEAPATEQLAARTLNEHQAARARPRVAPDCLAVVLTAGSTDRPKGVMLSARAFEAAAAASARNLGWQDDDRWLLCMPLAHVGGLSIVTRCLIARRAVVLHRRPPGASLDARALAEVVHRQRVTLLSLVPTMLERLLRLEPAFVAPPHLRAILLGGAPASPRLLEEARQRSLPVLVTYGMTEACSQIATHPYGTPPSVEHGVGRPVSSVEVRVQDGEIHVKGESLMMGYVPQGSHPDPFLPGGWLPTGDFGRLDEMGRLHLTGRKAELIITGGENVHAGEIERALAACPGIAAAAVFGVPDEIWGQAVAALLQPSGSSPPTDADLEQHLRKTLASYKRPRLIAYVQELPTTAGEKIDRAGLLRFSDRLRPIRAG